VCLDASKYMMAEQVEAFLNIDELDWHSLKHPLTKHKINKFKPLMLRIEDAQINQVIESYLQPAPYLVRCQISSFLVLN
jgi:methionyl-tRNA synthetase